MANVLTRRAALAGVQAFPSPNKMVLTEDAPMLRYSFRGPDQAASKLAAYLGLAVPAQNRAETGANGTLIRLGPDELMVIMADGDAAATMAQLGAAVDEPHSLVDISHRNVGMTLSGAPVELVLAAGNPLDLHIKSFPVGMATRTLLAKAEVVLWRRSADTFQIDCWRSFAPYLYDFLVEAAREFR